MKQPSLLLLQPTRTKCATATYFIPIGLIRARQSKDSTGPKSRHFSNNFLTLIQNINFFINNMQGCIPCFFPHSSPSLSFLPFPSHLCISPSLPSRSLFPLLSLLSLHLPSYFSSISFLSPFLLISTSSPFLSVKGEG